MKKIFTIIALLAMTIAANAQFEEGKKYLASSFSGVGASYNSTEELKFNIDVQGGYFLADNWMLTGLVGLYNPGKDMKNSFNVGAGLRYYVQQNGLYFGVKAKLAFSSKNTDLMPGAELGYAFFINDKVTIEPAVYYDMSTKDFSDRSTVGLKIGLGIYL